MDNKRDSSRTKSVPAGRTAAASPAAKERLAAALRENLQRRKAQARGQEDKPRDAEPEDTPG
ncbi:MAG: hypothetical protein K1X51_08625 [Rhodospirillaceae bacterium]|nr:hypothetical protein [Rhodospirillaceae bacterium]